MSITATTNQHKAGKRIQRALSKDPNDVKALLQLAALLASTKEPNLAQRRQVLHRILSLEPANQMARELLFEIDRATIGGDPARLSLAVILHPPSSSDLPEAPLTLRYSILRQILVYSLIACMAISGWSMIRDVGALLVGGAFLLVPLWFVSAVIEINDSGLIVSRLFGIIRSEIAWSDMREVRPTALGQGTTILNHQGKTVEISARIQGYPFLLDILRQRRPDVFHNRESTRIQTHPVAIPAVVKTVGKLSGM